MEEQLLDEHLTQQEDYPNANDYDEKLHGLSGWLAFLGFTVILSLLITVVINTKNYIPFLQQFPLYSFDQKLWISIELVLVIIMVVYQVVMLYYYFNKKKLFPKIFIGFLAYRILFECLEKFLIAPMLNAEVNYATFIQPLVYVVIWLSYILNSKRVKHTFVF